MPDAPTKRTRGHIGRGALVSLLLHAQLLGPLVLAAFIYGGREEAQKAEEVDVGFESVADNELPRDLPPLEPPKRADEALDALKPDVTKTPTKAPKKEPPKRERKAEAALAKPEPEILVPPMPPMPEAPPPPPPNQPDKKKIVDLDNGKSVPPPPNARYEAQVNNRAEEETRARVTNMDRTQAGKEDVTATARGDEKQVGAAEAKIAQLTEEKSRAGKEAPSTTPHLTTRPAEEAGHEHSLLSLRDNAPRAHELTPETADPSLPHAPDGDVALSRAARGRDEAAGGAKVRSAKLAFTGADYEYLFGADAEADRRMAQTQRSSAKGAARAQRAARVRAALENFIPEVKPGNQTALNTRAAPFAAYIARVHRSIHMLWGFGVLEEWDELSSQSPFNNQNLLTTLEMVLNGDGTVDKVTVVHASGYLAYDAAAIDVAYNAGPYPDPPRQIHSANGKIYFHWNFYRDGRQCSEYYAEPYILNNPRIDQDKADKASPGEAPAASGPAAPPGPGGERPAAESGPRRLQRGQDDDAHQAMLRAMDAHVAEAAGEAEEAPPKPTAAAPAVAEAQVPAARAATDRWFAALVAGDMTTLAGLSDLPFRTTGAAPIRTRAELTSMLRDLSSELSRHPPASVQVYTGAAIRSVIGHLPPGIDDGSGLLFAMASLGEGTHEDHLILALAKRGETYHVVALVRR